VQRGPSVAENNSEINYGVNNDAIERSYGRRKDNKLDIDRPDSHLNGPLEYQNDILKGDSISKASINSKSVANLGPVNNYGLIKLQDAGSRAIGSVSSAAFGGADGGTKVGGEGSLIQLRQMKAPNGSDEEDADGTLSRVLEDIGYEKTAPTIDASSPQENVYDSMINQSVDPQANSLLLQSDTVATFIFNSLKLGIGLDNGQAAQLLQNNFRFLVLLCIRGTKGGDYRALLDWYSLVINNLPHLVKLFRALDVRASQDGDQVAKALNVLRCGLLSKSSDVVNICTRFFTKFRKHLNENAQEGEVQQIMHNFWDWLSFEQSNASVQGSNRLQQVSPGRIRASKKG